MTLTLHPTTKFATAGGLKVRVWEGKTDRGTRCFALLAGVGLANKEGEDSDEAKGLIALAMAPFEGIVNEESAHRDN